MEHISSGAGAAIRMTVKSSAGKASQGAFDVQLSFKGLQNSLRINQKEDIPISRGIYTLDHILQDRV